MEPATYRTDGIVSVSRGKTDLDRQLEAWAKEPKCSCTTCARIRTVYGVEPLEIVPRKD